MRSACCKETSKECAFGPPERQHDASYQQSMPGILLASGGLRSYGIDTAAQTKEAASYPHSAKQKMTYLCVSERDKRLELVTTRLAFPQVLYAMPIKYPDHFGRNTVCPERRHSLVRHGDSQSETA